jgi:hypothetical protein
LEDKDNSKTKNSSLSKINSYLQKEQKIPKKYKDYKSFKEFHKQNYQA